MAKCPSRTCGREFTLKIDAKYAGRRMNIECPSCFARLIATVPAIPTIPAREQQPETEEDESVIETIITTLEMDVSVIAQALKEKLSKG